MSTLCGRTSVDLGRCSALIDIAPDAMLVFGGDNRLSLANDLAERLFGYAQAELQGLPVQQLVPEWTGDAAAQAGSRVELVGRRRGGEEFPIELSVRRLRFADCTDDLINLASIRDISQHRRIEASSKLDADRLASAIENIQDGFALFDSNRRLILCNSRYRQAFGTSVVGPWVGKSFEELENAWLSELALATDAERARFRAARLCQWSEPITTFDVRTLSGRTLRLIARRMPDNGLVKTIWDLTQDEHRAQELREARLAAETASASKSEFLSSMSHELRTPLNAILGFAQLTLRDKKEPLSERHSQRVQQVMTGGAHLLRLIDDVLDLSRIEAGGLSISPEPVDVLEVLEQVRTTLHCVARASNVQLRLALPAEDPPTVSVDRTRFAQILMNYGSNAIKYNRPNGTVTFSVSTEDPQHLRVTVSDTGIGIPLEHHHKIFQAFQRGGQEAGPIEGTGIGLAITKRLAELMEGSVGFRSDPARGSEFWVDAPVHSSGARTSTRPEAPAALRRLDERRRGVILYVEDNPANVKLMEDILRAFPGIELFTASTAEVGVELARARCPDIVIMDLNLPGMSGLHGLHCLQQWPETKAIPVIALTAAATNRDRKRAAGAGFYCYLTKPIDVSEFEATLETLLSR